MQTISHLLIPKQTLLISLRIGHSVILIGFLMQNKIVPTVAMIATMEPVNQSCPYRPKKALTKIQTRTINLLPLSTLCVQI